MLSLAHSTIKCSSSTSSNISSFSFSTRAGLCISSIRDLSYYTSMEDTHDDSHAAGQEERTTSRTRRVRLRRAHFSSTTRTNCRVCSNFHYAKTISFTSLDPRRCCGCAFILQACRLFSGWADLKAPLDHVFLNYLQKSTRRQGWLPAYDYLMLGGAESASMSAIAASMEVCSVKHTQQNTLNFDATDLKFHVYPAISGDTSSDEALTWTKLCLADCRKSHPECQQSEKCALPTRLLDLSQFDEACPMESRILVIQTNNQPVPYVCLSYCWGKNQDVLLTNSNLESFTQDGIPWSILPKTIQDAINFSRRLCYRYLWVDSLCIIQDDAKNKEVEIQKMGLVFKGSDLTLSVLNSKDVQGGCYRRSSAQYQGDPITGSNICSVRRSLPHFDLHTRNVTESHPLLSRAWTLQENLLASRILHFGPQELHWECKYHSLCECGNPIRGSKMKLGLSKGANIEQQGMALSTWGWILESYASRQLTLGSDRHGAILGVAREFEGLGSYEAGIWTSYLHDCVLWQVKTPKPIKPKTSWPSWSWLSICFSEASNLYHCYKNSEVEESFGHIFCELNILNSGNANLPLRFGEHHHVLEFIGPLLGLTWVRLRTESGEHLDVKKNGDFAPIMDILDWSPIYLDVQDAAANSLDEEAVRGAIIIASNKQISCLLLKVLDPIYSVYERVGVAEFRIKQSWIRRSLEQDLFVRTWLGEQFSNKKERARII
jgi:Heterokaryon incompatibility protein (HET)